MARRGTTPSALRALRATQRRRSKGDGSYEICQDFILDDWLRQKIAVSARAQTSIRNARVERKATRAGPYQRPAFAFSLCRSR